MVIPAIPPGSRPDAIAGAASGRVITAIAAAADDQPDVGRTSGTSLDREHAPAQARRSTRRAQRRPAAR